MTVDPTTTFAETADTYVADGNDPPNGVDAQYGPAPYFEVTTGGDRNRRALIKFNVSGIPDNAVIGQATMNLYGDGTGQDIAVHKLARSWTTSATWNRYDGTNAWTTPGGDFEAVKQDTVNVTSSLQWLEFSVGNAVADWVADTSTNHGLLLKAPTETTGGSGQGAAWYGTLNGATVPYIEVEWEDAIGVRPDYGFDTIPLSDRSELKVNLATGNVILSASDVVAKGVGGMDLNLQRAYNSRSAWGTQGFGWDFSMGEGVWMTDYNSGGTVIIRGPSTTLVALQEDRRRNVDVALGA